MTNRRWLVTFGVLGVSCGAFVVPACSSSSSSNGASPDGGDDSAFDSTTSSSGSGSSSSSSSSGSGSGSSSGSSSSSGGTDAAPDGRTDAAGDGSADATCQPFDAGTIDPNVADAGMQLVLKYRCYGCHQSNALDAGGLVLSGRNTSLSDAAAIFPPNLTPDPATGLGCWTTQQISTALLDGVDDQDASLCVMPLFRPRFIDAGLDVDGSASQIIAFLRSLNAVSNQVPNTVCPASPTPSDAGDAATDAGDGATE